MEKKEFRNLLKSWVRDLDAVNAWCFTQNGRRAFFLHYNELYKMIQTMWNDHGDIFPNKGTYKMIRRLLIKNFARFCNFQPGLWRNLPSDLCKEIMHKADQKWISFNTDIQSNFRVYLHWKAAQAGYPSKKGKQLCFVDDKLKIVAPKNAVGFANVLPDQNFRVEILFFEPLEVGNLSRSKAKEIIADWNRTHYPEHIAYLPTFATCRIANDFLGGLYSEPRPVVGCCHVDKVIRTSSRSNCSMSFALDDDGELDIAGNNTIAKKCYVSVYMPKEDFQKINPSASFPNAYITGWQRSEW